jgi:hypothetical protein
MSGSDRYQGGIGVVAKCVRRASVAAFLVVAAISFAEPVIPDGFWQSVLQIREEGSDFGGKTVGAFFKDVTFQRLELSNGASTTFALQPKSFDGSEVVLQYSILTNGAVSEYFDFHFKYKGTVSILYRLSRGEATLEGYQEMRRIMKEFYLPSLASD